MGSTLTLPGTVFAPLGPNGAGKTVTVQILSTLIGSDGGEIGVAGHDVATDTDAVRAAIGVTGQFSAVDDLLTGEENLMLMADLGHLGRAEGRRRAAGLLRRFDLVEAAGKTPAAYSGGMRRRLDLAMTLMGDPRIVFLDEPTTGLDPRSRRTMWRIIRDLVAGGATISDDAVPGGGGQARRRDRHPGPGKDRRRRYPDDLKRRIPGDPCACGLPTSTNWILPPAASTGHRATTNLSLYGSRPTAMSVL